jgi:hypothetical protein
MAYQGQMLWVIYVAVSDEGNMFYVIDTRQHPKNDPRKPVKNF